MTPEERERFKEAEKEHLRALKKLKQAAHQTRRRASINKALSDMAGALGQEDDPTDAHNEMLDKLELDTARQEARLEIALENAALKDAAAAAEASERASAKLEEETQKAKAKLLVEQMKLQMGIATPDVQEENEAEKPAAPSKTIGKTAPPEPETKPSPPSDRPEKTIGRMK